MALLLDLPVRVVEEIAGIGGDLSAFAGPISFDQLFDLVRTGRAVLDITTDSGPGTDASAFGNGVLQRLAAGAM